MECCPLTDFGGKKLHCEMSCDLGETNESAHCYEKISSYMQSNDNLLEDDVNCGNASFNEDMIVAAEISI